MKTGHEIACEILDDYRKQSNLGPDEYGQWCGTIIIAKRIDAAIAEAREEQKRVDEGIVDDKRKHLFTQEQVDAKVREAYGRGVQQAFERWCKVNNVTEAYAKTIPSGIAILSLLEPEKKLSPFGCECGWEFGKLEPDLWSNETLGVVMHKDFVTKLKYCPGCGKPQTSKVKP